MAAASLCLAIGLGGAFPGLASGLAPKADGAEAGGGGSPAGPSSGEAFSGPPASSPSAKKKAKAKAKKRVSLKQAGTPAPGVPGGSVETKAPLSVAAAPVPKGKPGRAELLARLHARKALARAAPPAQRMLVKQDLDKQAFEAGSGEPLCDMKAFAFEGGTHPFFKVDPAEEAGTFQFLKSAHPSNPGHRSIVCLPEGFMLWLTDRAEAIHVFAYNGMHWRIEVPGFKVFRSLIRDSSGRIWFFGDGGHGILTLNFASRDWDGLTLPYKIKMIVTQRAREVFRDSPTCIAATPDGGLIGGLASHHVFQTTPDMATDTLEIAPGLIPSAIAWEPRLKRCFLVHGHDVLMHNDQAAPKSAGHFRFRPGSVPAGIVLGADHRLWVTLSGSDSVAAVTPATGEMHYYSLAKPGWGRLGPSSIALGPDGNVWITLETGLGIARVTPAGEVSLFRLPWQLSPRDITAAHDGRMVFGVAGGGFLGSIKVFPALLATADPDRPTGSEGKTEMKEAPGGAAAFGRPVRQRPSREERHRRADEFALQAERRYQARLARDAAQDRSAPGLIGERPQAAVPPVPAGPEGKQERTGRNPSPPAPGPGAGGTVTPPADSSGTPAYIRLREMGFYLTKAGSEHIFDTHAWGRQADKSQFDETFTSRQSLDELIARGFELAGPRQWARMTDDYGNYYTLCEVRDSGWWLTLAGAFERTELFMVVTAPLYCDHGVESFEQVVITAYPVSKDWSGNGLIR